MAKIFKLVPVLVVALVCLAVSALAQNSGAAPHPVTMKGIGITMTPPPGFQYVENYRRTGNSALLNLTGSTIFVFHLAVDYDEACERIDTVVASTKPGFSRAEAHVIPGKAYRAQQFLHKNGDRYILSEIIGDSAESIILMAIFVPPDGDSTLEACRASFDGLVWKPHAPWSAADLKFTIVPAEPFTRVVYTEYSIACVSKDTSTHDDAPLFVVVYYPQADYVAKADRRARASSAVFADSGFNVRNIDSIRDVVFDSIPGVELHAVGKAKSSDESIQIYYCLLFPPNGMYVMLGSTADSAAARNMPAFEAMAHSFAFKPDYDPFFNNIGRMFQQKNYNGALAEANRYADAFPDSAQTFFHKAACEQILEMYHEAIRDADKSLAMQSRPGSPQLTLRAECEDLLGDTAAATKDYRQALKCAGWADTSNVLFSLGRRDFARKNYATAAAEVRKSVYIGDGFARIWLYFAEWQSTGNTTALKHLVKFNKFQSGMNILPKIFGPIARCLAGEITEQQLLDSVNNDPSFLPKDEALCKAYFYLGLNNMIQGTRIAGKMYWKKCLETGAEHLMEYSYAKNHMPKN